MVPVLFLFCVALRFILRGALCVYSKVFPCSLSSWLFVPFSIVINSHGEEGACLCASHEFVCLFCRCCFVFFSSSSWCRGLAAVCVALPGLFCQHLYYLCAGVVFFFFFFFLAGVGSRGYFTHFEPSQSLGGEKTGDPRQRWDCVLFRALQISGNNHSAKGVANASSIKLKDKQWSGTDTLRSHTLPSKPKGK